MKLQKQMSRRSGSTIYPKYVVVIPPEKVKEVGWREGEELEADVKDNKVILKTKR